MKYYVVFLNSNAESKIFKFLKEGFQHVEVLSEHGTLVAPLSGGLLVEKVNIDEAFTNYKNNGSIILEYEVKGCKILRSILGINTCVGVVKDILGIRNIMIQTPYQLYKHILKNGGKHYG